MESGWTAGALGRAASCTKCVGNWELLTKIRRLRDLFDQYRGSRYSFGYPACPNLEDQTKLFARLKPEENVVGRSTFGLLLEPKQSASAIVVHRPAAKYFVV
jgi:5-methyltetrahydrofolate--homocysteine methyltransferase